MRPLVKYFCTDAGIRAADLAIQVMGGCGNLREHRAEQNWRDARICPIYEGTNGIHAGTLATRRLTLNGGAGARAFAAFARDSGGSLGAGVEGWEAEAARLAASPDPSASAAGSTPARADEADPPAPPARSPGTARTACARSSARCRTPGTMPSSTPLPAGARRNADGLP